MSADGRGSTWGREACTPAFCNVPSGKLRLAKQSRRAWVGGGDGLADGGGGDGLADGGGGDGDSGTAHHEFKQNESTPPAMHMAATFGLLAGLTNAFVISL